jgi:ankyrin repeat protein
MLKNLNKKMIALLALLPFSVTPAYSMDLLEAADKGNVARVEQLIADGADVEMRGRDGKSPLHKAVYEAAWHRSDTEPYLKIIHRLLAAGAQVDTIDIHGNTPLFNILYGSLPFMQILLAAGADVHHENLKGETPLHHAAGMNDPALIRELINAGALVNKPAKDGQTPLHYSAEQSDRYGKETIEELFNRGGDLNCQDNAGETPLHKAARKASSPKMVATLLVHKADLSIKNHQGKMPSQVWRNMWEEDKDSRKGLSAEELEDLDYDYYKKNRDVYMLLMLILKQVRDNGYEVGSILALATHSRLGQDSPVQLLPQHLMATIAHMTAVQEQCEYERHPERPSLLHKSWYKIRTWLRSPKGIGISALGLITLGSIFAYRTYSHSV